MRGGGHWKRFAALIILVIILGMAPGAPDSSPVLAAVANPAGRPAPLVQGALVAMVSPADCPSGGCAAGQRMNMRFDFEPGEGLASDSTNVWACVYAPRGWAVNPDSVTAAQTGELTGETYRPAEGGETGCAVDTEAPAGYDLILERLAGLERNTPADALGFGFRIGQAGAGSGRVLARLFARTSGGWQRVEQATSAPTLTITPAQERSFVANDAATCGTAIPCYLNSSEDGSGGIGTGLKDAVDAIPTDGTIYVLGAYTIKSSTVLVNKSLTITGPGDSRITYTGSTCDNTMLRLTRGVTLTGLLINDGSCSSPSRGLIEVDSPNPVTIERNDLLNGGDAITLQDNEGPLLVQFNDIRGNSGQALRGLDTTKKGALTLVANNITGNKGAPVVDCSESATEVVANRYANHNYWGNSSPSSDDTHCKIESVKRLGMPIALEEDTPGVRGQVVTVAEKKAYASDFDRKIGYMRDGGDSDFPLYIIDHGFATAGGPPFSYARGNESPSPCSNYWDVFLPQGEKGSGALHLFFKYDRTPACLAAINSTQYCDQTTTPAKYPLYWYDPRSSNNKWITTGSKYDTDTEGQTTSCNIEANEIRVAMDSKGRPNMSQDLDYVPFFVGVPVIKSFLPLASSQLINVSWSTNNEPDVVGFYVLRGQSSNALNPITDLIPHTGTALVGRTYSFLDTGRVNGVTSYYRLQVLRSDGSSIYSAVVEIAANKATITPTRTLAPTWTPRPTNTRYPTFIPTRFPTRIPVRTPTTGFLLRTATRAPTALAFSTPRPTLDIRTPGAAQTMTVWALTPQIIFPTRAGEGGNPGEGNLTALPGFDTTPDGTEIALVPSETPSPTVTSTRTPAVIPGEINAAGVPAATQAASPWLSLLLGIGAGLAATGGLGAAWYFLFLKR